MKENGQHPQKLLYNKITVTISWLCTTDYCAWHADVMGYSITLAKVLKKV